MNIKIDTTMEDIVIPIFVCVVLPVTIVWLVTRAKQNETNKKAEIMIKAIEAGAPVDMEQFNSARKSPRTIKQDLLEKLNGACITGLMGIGFLVFGIVRTYNPDFGGLGSHFGRFLLPAGGIMLAVGIGLLVSYFVGKKMLAKEIEAEEKQLER